MKILMQKNSPSERRVELMTLITVFASCRGTYFDLLINESVVNSGRSPLSLGVDLWIDEDRPE